MSDSRVWIGLLIAVGVAAYGLGTHTYKPAPSTLQVSSVQAVSSTSSSTSTSTDCAPFIATQEAALKNDPLAGRETFGKYPASGQLQGTPGSLAATSSVYVEMFRGALKAALATTPVNFAGHYSIVSVGLTGWGKNYYIIDRATGAAYPFPYEATFLDFNKDSDLILMNSEHDILNFIQQNGAGSCMSTGVAGTYYTDARPFYLLWQNNQLEVLGPRGTQPPINPFWSEYFNPETWKTGNRGQWVSPTP